MELKDFIRATIVDISNGIRAAQDDLKDSTAIIAPRTYENGSILETESESLPKASMMTFDIDLEVDESHEQNQQSGSLSLNVVGFAVSGSSNGGDKDRTGQRSTTHISFSVPVVWPADEKQRNRYGQRSPNHDTLQRQDYDPLSWDRSR